MMDKWTSEWLVGRLSWQWSVRVMAVAGLVAVIGAWNASVPPSTHGRSGMLVSLMAEQGLSMEAGDIVWMHQPPFTTSNALRWAAPAVFRARTGPDEPHDIFVVYGRMSSEGALLSVGRVYNLTETSAVDEGRPVVRHGHVAFVERPLMQDRSPRRFRLISFRSDGERAAEGAPLSSVERAQTGLTRLQQTGSWDGLARYAYSVEPAPETLDIRFSERALSVKAGQRHVKVDLEHPDRVPAWLVFERGVERRPGNLVTWAVDRVRAEIGDNAMQYIKAFAFSALDVVLSGKEAVSGDTAEGDIAADLGQTSLDPVERQTPVDPVSGFPPPPLDLWVKPGLPGEGKWNPKDKDPFIHSLPGLPPVFYTTFIRSDRRRKVTRVYIALWDPRVVQLNMMAGVAEPKSATGETGPGLIPREPSVMKRVVAACNAGFQSLHGEYGMMADGVVYLPPKPYGATVAKMRDGSVGFGSWPEDPTIPDDMLSYRQNMTALVLDGKFNPYGRTWWGGTPDNWEDKTHTVRTGICRTKEDFVGYFYGADLSPRALAQAMIQSRCVYGIALDMNAGHSGLEYYKVGPKDSFEPLGRPVRRDWEREGEVKDMPGWNFRARRLVRGMGLMHFPRYIRREGRDFFYLTVRHLLPGRALPGAKPDGPEIGFDVKGLAQHGYPYVMAQAQLGDRGGLTLRALKVDPRLLTLSDKDAVQSEASKPAVVLAVPPVSDQGDIGLWFSDNAFFVAPKGQAPSSVRLLAGRSAGGSERAVAAVGVEQESGMLVYVEAQPTKEQTTVAATHLLEPLKQLGTGPVMLLSEPWRLALGGDGDLAGQPRRPEKGSLPIWRKSGPGARGLFPQTPIKPLKYWYRLQAKRIRYFKKRKKKKEP